MLNHVDREVLLADGVQRRYQGHQERRVADGEQPASGSIAGVKMPAPLCAITGVRVPTL